MITANDTPALILVALADPCCYPACADRLTDGAERLRSSSPIESKRLFF